MSASKIVDLRKLLAARFPQERLPPNECLRTGLTIFDETPAGGLTKSAVTELVSPPAQAGSATVVAALLERAAQDRYFLALIDGRDSFDPESVRAAALSHLLWTRCHQAREAIQAADLLLRDGNFPLVILDLVLNPLAELRSIPASHWYRLQRLVEPGLTALLVLTQHKMVSSAQWKLTLQNRWLLPQLEAPREELCARLQIQLHRAQPNKWRNDEEMRWAG